MPSLKILTTLMVLIFIALLNDNNQTEARYLPTRSSSDRIDKLKELLKEVSKILKV